MSHEKSNAVGHSAKELIGGDNIPPEGPGEFGTGGPADGALPEPGSPKLNQPHALPNVGISRFFGEGVEE